MSRHDCLGYIDLLFEIARKIETFMKLINRIRVRDGFSMTELMVVLVIIGILVLLALPRLRPVVTKAKTTEAKLMLKQVYTLEQSYKFEHDRYSQALPDIGFEQEKLTSEGGQARYKN